jgi:hypothetical protein
MIEPDAEHEVRVTGYVGDRETAFGLIGAPMRLSMRSRGETPTRRNGSGVRDERLRKAAARRTAVPNSNGNDLRAR